MLGPDPRREQADVVDQRCPAALAEVAECTGFSAGAVAAVILGVDDEPGVVQRPRHMVVALGVLSHSVR